MREPSCEATIKTLKEVEKMNVGQVEQIFIEAPLKVKQTLAALLLAIPAAKPGELDDWECDLGDILFTEIK